ncbi:MAG: hypothetical protein QF654_12545 [Alphaproteobacteria bacterium]|jgi:flagellar M-ring protein FliF|nr:hypothetical protein [Alphaproteobacteria bacterium]
MSDRALKMLRIYLDARADEEAESEIDTRRVDGEIRASARRVVGEIIERHPDRAVSIIRKWMIQYH